MIQKVEKLVSIGKFRNYSATGNVAFNKLTLIYADNGSGKTTLSAVLRSFTKNEPSLIKSRISTNASLPQAAQIIQRLGGTDTHFTFGRSGWSGNLDDVEIFDIYFVNENIYSGFDFNDDQKKQLHQFVIGVAGIGVRQQIEQNKADKATFRQTQESIEQNIIRTVGNGLNNSSLPTFITIAANQNTNIDQRIATAETALRSANSNAVLQTLSHLAFLTPFDQLADAQNLVADLEMNATTLMNASLNETFANHCTELNENRVTAPESWLRTGFNYLESKHEHNQSELLLTCPFCRQNIDENLAIIQAYTLKFNDEFNSLVTRLNVHATNLEQYNLNALIQSYNNINRLNVERIASWATHLPNTIHAPVYNIFTDENTLRQSFGALNVLLKQKLRNPSISLRTTEILAFHNLIDKINLNVAVYNRNITLYNAAIATFLRGIQTVIQAQNEVMRLKMIRLRFDPNVITLIANLSTVKTRLRTLGTTYSTLIAQQQTAASSFFNRYKDRINHYLTTVFKTPFLIDRVVHVPPQGRATLSKIDYKLVIDGIDISFDAAQPNCAKDCLSEGDKSTIALAFFLSKLDIDGAIGNKIVVFDDPLSSFDRNRRLYTVQLIRDLLPNVKQVIVLSHNETFLHQVSKTTSAANKSCLRISENFISNSAFIEPLSLDTLVENDYFKHVGELEGFLTNPDITKKEMILGLMRNVLEAHITFKFYRQLNHLPPNNRTFGILITALDNPSPVVFRVNANRPGIISKLNLINGVSCKPHHGEPVPDYITLGLNPTSITTTELAHLVQDTLDLIDNLL
jgi:wobble nucleotide-excising tRNase